VPDLDPIPIDPECAEGGVVVHLQNVVSEFLAVQRPGAPDGLDAELVAAELVLAERRVHAGLGERRADPDRRLCLRDRRDRQRQRREEGDGEDLPGLAHGR